MAASGGRLRRRVLSDDVGIAVLTVLGTTLALTGAAIPFSSAIGAEAYIGTWEDQLTAIPRGPGLWRVANGLWIAGTVLVVVAVTAGGERLATAYRIGIAHAGEVLFAIGGALWIGVSLLRASVLPWLAERAADDADLAALWEPLADLWAVELFQLCAFAGLALLGLSAQRGHRAGLGSVLAAVGAGGVVLTAVGASIPAFPFLASLVLGIGLAVTGGAAAQRETSQ